MTRATPGPASGLWPFLLRCISWGTVTVAFAFLVENYLVHWRGQPGALSFLRGDGGGWLAATFYALAVIIALILVMRGQKEPFRRDSDRISAIVAYLARASFFAVLFVGLGDAAISWLRVEDLLSTLVGDDLAGQLAQARFRGPNVHVPLAVLGFAVAFFTRTLGFIWLALLVVLIQLLMVIGRFIFSYEQAFTSDLVRMWYAALFLFASAYTLVEEGHVRVDIFFSAMSRRSRAVVNGLGSVVLGMTLCWVILFFGSATSASTLIGPFLRFEQGQQTYGMMTKYTLAVFLGVFAVTMLLQFASYLLKAAADWRDEHDPKAVHDSDTDQTPNLAAG